MWSFEAELLIEGKATMCGYSSLFGDDACNFVEAISRRSVTMTSWKEDDLLELFRARGNTKHDSRLCNTECRVAYGYPFKATAVTRLSDQ